MNPISIIRQFIKGLLKDNEPYQIGLAVAFGLIIGVIPKNNITAQLIFIIAVSTKANIPFLILSIFFFSSFSLITDILTDKIGYFILTREFLNAFFTKMYNTPFIPWTDFNNTVVMGGVIVGIVVFFPVYLLGKKFGAYYKEKLANKISNLKFIKMLKASWLFEWYFNKD
ncbi:MAG: TIGR03546 family protein [Elusimicrobiota bacterium]